MTDSNKYTPKAKVSIQPFTITVTLEATKINENGTFSAFKVVDCPENVHVSQPFQGGGSLYFKLDDSIQTKADMKKAGVIIEAKPSTAHKTATPRKLF